MSSVALDTPVPEFSLPATGDKNISLSDFKGKQNVVIYFYPKDSTPGCTTEGQDFTSNHSAFETEDTVILGVSRDGIKSHENFKDKQAFTFDLLSDKEEELCKLFDVIKLKKMYGKESLGIERSTFIIDKDGVLRKEWRGVKVPGHVDEVLAAVRAL